MRDPMTFEARLADAFDRYVAPVDVDVDARALSSTIAAAGRRARPSWHSLLMPDKVRARPPVSAWTGSVQS